MGAFLMDAMGFIVFGIFFVIVVIYSVISHRRAKRQWLGWTRARNWPFLEKWPEMASSFSGGPFGEGSSRRASFGYTGRVDGLSAAGFDYQYSIGSGDNRSTYHFHVDLVRVPGANFPFLELSQEGLGKRLFGRDTEFENIEFNRRWFVTGQAPRFTHDILHPRAMEFFLANPPGFSALWFERDCVLVARTGSGSPDLVDPYLRLLSQVVGLIPAFVLRELGTTKPAQTLEGPWVSLDEQQRRIAQFAADDARGPEVDPMYLVWGVMGLMMVVVGYGLWSIDKQETRRWAQWAGRRGWAFHTVWPGLLAVLRGGPTGIGHSRMLSRGYEGRFNGATIRGGRYSYTIGGGKTSRVVTLGINGVRIPGAGFPPVTAVLHTALTRPFEGPEEIEFENSAFNHRWQVTSPDQRIAHAVIHPRLMQLLMTAPHDIGMVWVHDDYCWVASREAIDVTAVVDRHLSFAGRVAALLPQWLLDEQGATRPTLTAAGAEPVAREPNAIPGRARPEPGAGRP